MNQKYKRKAENQKVHMMQNFQLTFCIGAVLNLTWSLNVSLTVYLVLNKFYSQTSKMPVCEDKDIATIETIVKLYGNHSDNIQAILQNMNLTTTDLQNVRTVLSILYAKMEKLRHERNQLRLSLYQREQMLQQSREEIKSLKKALQVSQQQLETMKMKPDEYTFENSINQTPPLKQAYRSVQIEEDKQNRPIGLGEVKFVSSFESQPKEFGGQFRSLMKKYNLSADEFKQVIILYVEEEQKALRQLQTDSQKELYLQSKKTKNYREWFKKMCRERRRGKSSSSSLGSFPEPCNVK